MRQDNAFFDLDYSVMGDLALLILAKECDNNDAAKELVTRHFNKWVKSAVRKWSRETGLRAQDTEDAIQDSVEAIYRAVGKFDTVQVYKHGGCGFATFLGILVHDRFRDFCKKLKRSKRGRVVSLQAMQEEHDFVHESTSTDKAPLSAIVRSESVERLRAAINKLTDELRELTTLVLAEVSVKGIAAKLGISYYAAKRRKKAAFRRLA